MKVLQAVQNGFISMGFNPKSERFNHILLTNIAVTMLPFHSLWIYLFYEANNSQEYMEVVYFIAGSTCIAFSASNTIFIKEKLFSFINFIDGLANESK